ncbi:unnamed protein product [Dracunculus medinensis]|uniref:DUF1758 domain-containing protein n=1 Tax=Dracunculus medinensis TaxID=318479 RepID=A0A0N4UMK9_DRAME|nr:unnamed protein product [Dracunculus medinensis]
MGENLEQSSIEIIVESRLPAWILERIYQQKEQESWSVNKLRQFLGKLVLRSEEVMRIQSLNMTKNQEPVKSKSKPFSRFIPNETSALSVKTKRPCIFCNKDHWDNECQVYSTVKQRTKRLKELKAYLNCFDNSHKTTDCKSRKCSCFYCKGPHNTALCEEKYQGHNESNKKESKKVNVINPIYQEIRSEAIVLFDTGAQTSFVSKKLAQKLKLEVDESGVMRIASFSNKYSTSSPYYTTVGPILAGSGDATRPPKFTGVTTISNCKDITPTSEWPQRTPTTDKPNDEDNEQALNQFKDSITKINGRYQVSWP